MKVHNFFCKDLIFLIILLFFANVATSQDEFVVDNWQWELQDVICGHASELSKVAVSTPYLSVTENVEKKGSGSVEVISKLQHDTGNEVIDCEETYKFEWEITSSYRTVPLDDGVISIEVRVSANSDLQDNCLQCDGSNDGTIVAHGSSGVPLPAFFPEDYNSDLGTDGTTGKAYGFSDFYPNSQEGYITFPFWYGTNYPDYIYFFISMGVSNAKANGVLEYVVAYVYKRTNKNEIDEYFNSLPAINTLLLGSPSGAVD